MEVCRLCLDLLHDNNFCHLEGPHKEMIQLVTPELNLEISPNPTACKGCLDSLDKLYKFKKKFFEIERDIKEKLNNRPNNLGLREIVKGVSNGDAALTDKAKDRLCRTCLECIECESFTVLTPSNPDAYLDSMLIMCLPELDLKLSKDPVMCEKCFNNLQELHHLKSTSLDVEEKINNYCALQGTNSHSQINLHNVLQSSVNTKSQYSNLVFVKTEEIDDDNVDNATKEIVMPESKNGTESPMVKLEDMDVKVEGADEEDKIQIDLDSIREICANNSDPHIISAAQADDETEADLNCDVCGKFFSTIWNLSRHKMIHTGEKPFECDKCESKFAHKSVLIKHLRKHTGEKPFGCNLCDKRFSGKSNLNSHLKTHKGIRPYTCGICGHEFTQKSNLKKHIKRHSGEKTFECEVCQKKFASKYSVQSHMEIHNGEKPYFCEICQESFRHLSLLRVHQLIHIGRNPYTCSMCDMQFAHKSALNVHERTHLGQKPFACPVCGKRFVKKSIVDSHMTIHTGEKHYKCFMCGRKYADKSKLNYHLKKKCLKGISMTIKVR